MNQSITRLIDRWCINRMMSMPVDRLELAFPGAGRVYEALAAKMPTEQIRAELDELSPPINWPVSPAGRSSDYGFCDKCGGDFNAAYECDGCAEAPTVKLTLPPRMSNHPPTLPQREDWHLPPVTSATPETFPCPKLPAGLGE